MYCINNHLVITSTSQCLFSSFWETNYYNVIVILLDAFTVILARPSQATEECLKLFNLFPFLFSEKNHLYKLRSLYLFWYRYSKNLHILRRIFWAYIVHFWNCRISVNCGTLKAEMFEHFSKIRFWN